MNKEQINSLLSLPLAELVALADKTRQEFIGQKLDLCTISNAKSGYCDQDCKFCSQSSRHHTETLRYPLKQKEEILEEAMRARDIGAERFGIVTSGNRLSEEELKRIADVIREISDKIGIKICASLGSMDERGFLLLKEAGLSRYHHNLETSPNYFSNIATTHSFQDRIDTLKLAKKTGFEVCSGGIIGLGETIEDRIEMALHLKELNVDSIPINVLVAIKGTPLETQIPLSTYEVIKTIAIFRIILKDKAVKIAAGRESVLKDFQGLAFMAGANGMLIGGYLTVKGREIKEDQKLVEEIKKIWQK